MRWTLRIGIPSSVAVMFLAVFGCGSRDSRAQPDAALPADGGAGGSGTGGRLGAGETSAGQTGGNCAGSSGGGGADAGAPILTGGTIVPCRDSPVGSVVEFPVPTASNLSGITTGADGNVWFTEHWGNRIGRITPTGTITELAIPTAKSQPEGITAGPDGNLWFTEYDGDRIGRITP